jgi:hypothetical protein
MEFKSEGYTMGGLAVNFEEWCFQKSAIGLIATSGTKNRHK